MYKPHCLYARICIKPPIYILQYVLNPLFTSQEACGEGVLGSGGALGRPAEADEGTNGFNTDVYH
jgi:hypothetical protein